MAWHGRRRDTNSRQERHSLPAFILGNGQRRLVVVDNVDVGPPICKIFGQPRHIIAFHARHNQLFLQWLGFPQRGLGRSGLVRGD